MDHRTHKDDPARSLAPAVASGSEKTPLLAALGERVRTLRARRGLTRKAVALAAGVSERHLANLELGTGNASILILDQIARALQSPLAELVGDVTTSSPEWLMLRELLSGRGEVELRRVRLALADLLGPGADLRAGARRVALIGLRGAGKSTLGRMLADDLQLPFVELSRQIEQVAGCSIGEIHDLCGAGAYRRYERRAVEEAVRGAPEAVLAVPGGLVSDPASFNLLLAHCLTVWLQASPEEHMARVAAQGDLRPIEASREAMDDLRRILAGRAAFYAQADLRVDTSGRAPQESFQALRSAVRGALKMPP